MSLVPYRDLGRIDDSLKLVPLRRDLGADLGGESPTLQPWLVAVPQRKLRLLGFIKKWWNRWFYLGLLMRTARRGYPPCYCTRRWQTNTRRAAAPPSLRRQNGANRASNPRKTMRVLLVLTHLPCPFSQVSLVTAQQRKI